ncbi:hypothetical protein L596_021795 [Steinernema carpocapsae]|uniref:Uncharacterized protein n=1 Tax=Steinernema carpocapsae TaxID=34508 RepID=A0A4U5MJU8_STECR|nr:hypothetical protein L596_021795 [Steinernema carpocapsae]
MFVASLMQLPAFFFGGFMTIFQSNLNFYLERVLGILIESTWFLYLSLSLTLAIDRLLIFAAPNHKTFNERITIVLLLLSWAFWLGMVIVQSLPSVGYGYIDNYVWIYTDAWSSCDGCV